MTSPRSVEQGFAPDFASVAAARAFTDQHLGQWQRDDIVWAAQLAVSELATNCVLHARTPFTVALRLLADGALRLEVGDGVRRVPRQRHYSVDSTTGRGVALVSEIARAWGVQQRSGGKTVWCEIAADPAGGRDQPGHDEESAYDGVDLDAFLGAADREELAGRARDPQSRDAGAASADADDPAVCSSHCKMAA